MFIFSNFRHLAAIHPKTGTPLLATIITGVLASFMSLLVGLQILVEMMSIGEWLQSLMCVIYIYIYIFIYIYIY